MAEVALHKAAVIGAGAMGAGIAGALANAGVPVLLLDRPDDQGGNSIAAAGLRRQIDAGALTDAALVQVGNTADDLAAIADADWIVEAVFEDLTVKRDLYARIAAVRRAGAILSSNTSTFPLAELLDGLPEDLRRDFVITHFFNPPGVMPLLELVTSDKTSPQVADRIDRIGREVLGKTVIGCRDTPGFVANRIGCFWMSVAACQAIRMDVPVERADTLVSVPFGIPKTGVFGLFDLIGLNLVPSVWASLMRRLPAEDPHRRFDVTQNAVFRAMLERGLTGRRAGGGFYRRRDEDGCEVDQVLDLASMTYRPRETTALPAADPRHLMDGDSLDARYVWSVFSETLLYAARLADTITSDPADVDIAMRLGYGWTKGPFALSTDVGRDWINERLRASGRPAIDWSRIP